MASGSPALWVRPGEDGDRSQRTVPCPFGTVFCNPDCWRERVEGAVGQMTKLCLKKTKLKCLAPPQCVCAQNRPLPLCARRGLGSLGPGWEGAGGERAHSSCGGADH